MHFTPIEILNSKAAQYYGASLLDKALCTSEQLVNNIRGMGE